MFYLNQEHLADVEGLQVYGGKCEDFPDVWDLIDNKEYFFNDFDNVVDKASFSEFYKKVIYDVCLARYKGEIVYASWIVISGWKSFYYCAVAKKSSPILTKKLFDVTVNYYKKYNLNRFDALVNSNNRVSRLCLQRLGFKSLGRTPKLFQVKGIDTDYHRYYLEV